MLRRLSLSRRVAATLCPCENEYACMYVCMHACMHVCKYACMHVCMYVNNNTCMYVCMGLCMYVCMYACMCVRMFTYTHICVCVRTVEFRVFDACPSLVASLTGRVGDDELGEPGVVLEEPVEGNFEGGC